MPQRRAASAPPSTHARPRTAGKSEKQRPSSGDGAVDDAAKQASRRKAGKKSSAKAPRVSKRGHMVADSWSRGGSSRRRSWMLEDHPNADVEHVIERWRDADQMNNRASSGGRKQQPTTAVLQKLPSSEQARKVLAGELSPRTALPFLHSVKAKLANEKENIRIKHDARAATLRRTLHRGALVAGALEADLVERRALTAERELHRRLEAEAEERRRRRDLKVAERKRTERQRLRMRGIYTYVPAADSLCAMELHR